MKPVLIFSLSLLSFIAACGDRQIEDTPKIALDRLQVAFESAGGDQIVTLTSSNEWSVGALPEWITIDRAKGTKSEKLTLTAQRNHKTEARKAQIEFKNQSGKATLDISQLADEHQFSWSPFAFNAFQDISYMGTNAAGDIHKFETVAMFAPCGELKKIFLGNIFKGEIAPSGPLSEATGLTRLPITVSSTRLVKPTEYVPSLDAQQKYVEQIISANSNQNEWFRFNNFGVRYTSRRELHLLGMANMGIALDKTISGKLYSEQKMTRKNGLVFSFGQAMFTLMMDSQEKLVAENPNPADGALSYINSVTYGRWGLLIIETDSELTEVKEAVNIIFRGQTPTAEQTAILSAIDAWHICYGAEKLNVIASQKSAIESFRMQIAEVNTTLLPMRYTVTNLFEPQGDSELTFGVTLP